ncbi:hypothetical protein F5Y18DRAFT_424353 [Xylariaceae sp. FL1019]|nr:hypothetical protein F5Y18DRAFT_424353 [Xylariaceae sp. FL1019]
MSTLSHQEEADKQLWQTGMVSDMIMRCGTKTWKLHKAILVYRVPTLSMLARNVATASIRPHHARLEAYVRLFRLCEILNLEKLGDFCIGRLKDLHLSAITTQLPRPQGNGRLLGGEEIDGIFAVITSTYEHENPPH